MSGLKNGASLRQLLGASAMTANSTPIQTPRSLCKVKATEELDDEALEKKAKQNKLIMVVAITAVAAFALSSL